MKANLATARANVAATKAKLAKAQSNSQAVIKRAQANALEAKAAAERAKANAATTAQARNNANARAKTAERNAAAAKIQAAYALKKFRNSRAAASTGRAKKIEELQKLVKGLNVSNLFEQQQNKLAIAKKVLGNNASNTNTINASINQLKAVTTAVRVRKNAAAEEEKRKKAEENARKKAEENALRAKRNVIKERLGITVSNNQINQYLPAALALNSSGLTKTEISTLAEGYKKNKKVASLKNSIRTLKGAPIVIGIIRPGQANMRIKGLKKTYRSGFTNGLINNLDMKETANSFRSKVAGDKTSLDAVLASDSAGILLMGASGSGKTVFANNLNTYLKGLTYTHINSTFIAGAATFNRIKPVDSVAGFRFEQKQKTLKSNNINRERKTVCIFGMTHAKTPFNGESSRVQEIKEYTLGNSKTLYVVDMAGNENIKDLYEAFINHGYKSCRTTTTNGCAKNPIISRVEIPKILMAIKPDDTHKYPKMRVNFRETTGSTIDTKSIATRFMGVIDRHSNSLSSLYDEYYLDEKYGIKQYVNDAGAAYHFSTILNESKNSSFRGFVIPQKLKNKYNNNQDTVFKEYAMLCYIGARLLEGVYITSTITGMALYLSDVRKNIAAKKKLNNNSRLDIAKSIFLSNIPYVKIQEGIENSSISTATANHASGQLTRIISKMDARRLYTLYTNGINGNNNASKKGYMNAFVKYLTKIKNIAIFPVFNLETKSNKGGKSENPTLSANTYKLVQKLTNKINTNN